MLRTAIALILVGAVMVGCAGAPRNGKPVAKEFSGSDPDAQVNFWHAMTDEVVASNDQAFHALLLYVDGKDDSADYAGRVAALKARSMLPAHFSEPAEASVSKGTMAVAIMRLLHEPGGITTRIFGPTPRYAVRELMFINVFPPSTPNQALTGNELVGIIGAVEDYQRGNPAAYPATVLPNEMKAASTQAVRE